MWNRHSAMAGYSSTSGVSESTDDDSQRVANAVGILSNRTLILRTHRQMCSIPRIKSRRIVHMLPPCRSPEAPCSSPGSRFAVRSLQLAFAFPTALFVSLLQLSKLTDNIPGLPDRCAIARSFLKPESQNSCHLPRTRATQTPRPLGRPSSLSLCRCRRTGRMGPVAPVPLRPSAVPPSSWSTLVTLRTPELRSTPTAPVRPSCRYLVAGRGSACGATRLTHECDRALECMGSQASFVAVVTFSGFPPPVLPSDAAPSRVDWWAWLAC